VQALFRTREGLISQENDDLSSAVQMRHVSLNGSDIILNDAEK